MRQAAIVLAAIAAAVWMGRTVYAEEKAQDLSHELAPAHQTKLVPGGRKPTVFLPITFESGSAELTADSKKMLDQVIQALQSPDLKGSRFKIEDHTDSNLRLSQQRANSVSAYLEKGGVASARLQAVGRGKADPIADDATAEGRRRNRRVELINLGASS